MYWKHFLLVGGLPFTLLMVYFDELTFLILILHGSPYFYLDLVLFFASLNNICLH